MDYKMLFIYFIIYSTIGCIIEFTYRSIVEKKLVYPGFLYGPYCPVYGFAAVFLLLTLSQTENNFIEFFIGAVFVTSVFEYIAAVFLEKLMNIRLWDYSKNKFNIKGRVALLYSIGWGFLAYIFIKFLHPFLNEYLFRYLLGNFETFIVVVLGTIFLFDVIISIKKAVLLRKNMTVLKLLRNEISELESKLNDSVSNSEVVKELNHKRVKYYKKLTEATKRNFKFLKLCSKRITSVKMPNVISDIKNIKTKEIKLNEDELKRNIKNTEGRS